MRRFYFLAISVALAVSSGCSLGPQKTPQQLYELGVMDAAVAMPEKITPLKPLPPGASVKLVSWVTAARVPCDGKPACNWVPSTYDYTWVTLDGEVRQLCQQWHLSGDKLRRRLEQLLGLPPDSPAQFLKQQFVTLEVPRTNLARACRGVNMGDSEHPECTLESQDDTPIELKNYVQQQIANSYVLHSKNFPGYPFTRLGYTYDWNPKAAKNHYGASEFLIVPNTPVQVLSIISTDDYCRSGN